MSIIQIYVSGKVRDGKVEALRLAMQGVVAVTRAHDGVISFQFYMSNGDTNFHGFEVFRDAGALRGHMAALGDPADGAEEIFEDISVSMFGDVTEEIRKVFEPLNPTYGRHLGGFTRLTYG